jgi:hypothetical protein
LIELEATIKALQDNFTTQQENFEPILNLYQQVQRNINSTMKKTKQININNIRVQKKSLFDLLNRTKAIKIEKNIVGIMPDS